MRTAIALVALALATTACTDIGSGDLMTSGMSAVITGTADGTGSTEVVAVLRAGGMASNTFVDLESGDELTVTAAEESAVLTKRSLGVLHSYAATVPVDAADTPFTVSLDRTLDEGAPASTFTLPAPIGDADAGTTLSPEQDLTVTWTPADDGDEMEIVVDGECIVLWSTELDGDPGSATVPHAEIDVLGDEPGTSCPVDVTLRRVRGGQLDPGFGEGGQVQGHQIATFTVSFDRGS